MKSLSDGSEVSSRSYYFLLDYIQFVDREALKNFFAKNSLNELDKDEYIQLFDIAVHEELQDLGKTGCG